ncbi:MAG: hypothetical protein PHS14_20460, partial [Elusimicrobia bacterium]|nr:hypothetical protein [Elusimicrobiota bacterium]
MLTLENMPRAGALDSNIWALGLRDVDAFDALPSTLRAALADEARDPDFLHGYLIPVLRTPDPYQHLLSDMARELEAERRGLDGYMGHIGMDGLDDLGKSFFKKIGSKIKKVAKKVVEVHKKVLKKAVIEPHKKLYEAHKKV